MKPSKYEKKKKKKECVLVMSGIVHCLFSAVVQVGKSCRMAVGSGFEVL